MESLIVLAGLFFIGGPILLLFLVVGARSRVSILETQVSELQNEVRRLGGQPIDSATARTQATASETAVFDWQEQYENRVQKTAFSESAETVEPPEKFPEVLPPKEIPIRPIAAEVVPIAIPDNAALASMPEEPPVIEGAQAFEMPPPPAWLVSAKEWLFGGNLVAKAGLLILFFGVSFLLKYAAARVTLPIELRLSGIVLADIGLLLWGWRIRESRPSISLPVQGAALGILMLVTFGAFRLYDLIPGSLAFGLLFALTAFTCLLAVLQDAIWLAIFGIVGGFAAPILTSTGHGSHIGLFSYYALLNAGILAIALKRSWRLLNLLGFVFTFLIATTWGVLRYEPENYLSAQGFLILFFVFYVAISILYANRQAPRLKHYVDGTLVFGTPLVAFGLQYGIVHDKPFGLAFSALALGLFYIGLTLALWKRRGDSLKLLIESFLALGIVFGTLAIPFALDGRWTSAAWALEGAGIVWVGLRQKQTLAWVFGVLVQVGAWLSFMGSMAGLDPALAVKSNLWLGFLLLAITGFLMAVNFRREIHARADESEDGENPSSTLLTWLSTGFLGVAALWLLAGAWMEIFLRVTTDTTHMHTLLVLSAMAVAAILGLIARRLDWSASRYFSLAPQLAAGLAFLWLLGFGTRDITQIYSANLFETGFLSSLLIALGAFFSSFAFQRQPEQRHQQISRMLLAWGGFWWFYPVLGNLNAWSEYCLDRYALFAETLYPKIHLPYVFCVALGTLVVARIARRLSWPDLRWLAYAVWPALLYVTVEILFQLDNSGYRIPGGPVWAALIAVWLASEWLLRDGEQDGWLLAIDHPRALRLLHALRIVGPWLIIWPLGHHLVALGLQASTPEEAALLAEAGWFTSGSWARYLPAWVMMAYIAALIPRARSERWPTTPISAWYSETLIPLGVIWSLALVALWNVTQNGRMQPLPYLPVLNPLDLTTGFAALLAVSGYRHFAETNDRLVAFRLPLIGALAGYVWFNLMLLRTAAHFLDIPYQIDPLFRSQFIQAMLSLVWSATALVLMRLAAAQKLRGPWMGGAGLLVLVVAKLFFVDLTNVGGIERIISFLGVGVLMLAIGYLAPFPTEKTNDEK